MVYSEIVVVVSGDKCSMGHGWSNINMETYNSIITSIMVCLD